MFVDFDASSPKRSRRACPVATLGPRESKACSITRLAASASTGASPFRNGIRATLKTPRRGDDHGLGPDTFIEFCSRAEAATDGARAAISAVGCGLSLRCADGRAHLQSPLYTQHRVLARLGRDFCPERRPTRARSSYSGDHRGSHQK